MAILRKKDIHNMSKEEREKKLKELKMELIKSKANTGKSSNIKIKEIKRTLARILTINK